MNNFIPTKVRDLSESKQRVMQKVVNEIENKSRKPKYKWRYAMIAAALSLSVMLFVVSEIVENAPQPATEQDLDLTEPAFTNEKGTLYLYGLTLGDPQSKVIDRLGEDYTIDQDDSSGADLVMNYHGHAKFYFYKGKIDSMVFTNVDENHLNKLFSDYDGFKFFLSMLTAYDGRFIFSKETNQVLMAPTAEPGGNIQLSLNSSDPDFTEIAEYLYMAEQNIKGQIQSPTDSNIDLAKPSFSEEQGRLYIHGVTLDDSPAKVIERLGGNYLIGKVDSGEETDFVIDYNGQASFTFFKGKLNSILLRKVDKTYFSQIYDDYEGFKFVSSPYDADSDRFIYTKESKQALKATTNVPNEDLYLYLSYPDPTFYEYAEMQDLD